MVGMSIAPIQHKGNDHIRAEAADDFDHLPNQHLWLNAGERAIHIIQIYRMLNYEAQAGQVQFLLTYYSKRAACRDVWTANLAGLPCVADTTITSAPLAVYFAKVPPAQNVSSSGWAKTPRMRGAPSTDGVLPILPTLLPYLSFACLGCHRLHF